MKRLFLTTAIAATAMIIMACSGTSASADGNPSSTTQELPGQTLADESPSQNMEMVISAKGIDGILMLDMALDKLPPLIDGLYDKVQLAHEEDEGDIVTVADFTLNGTTVITGVSDDGKTIGKLDFQAIELSCVLVTGHGVWVINPMA